MEYLQWVIEVKYKECDKCNRGEYGKKTLSVNVKTYA